MRHLCRWLRVSLDHGPTNHPRAQGAAERLGGRLQEALTQLCHSWPQRWDDFVPVATWVHRVTPDEHLPDNASPYRILLGREPRSHIDVMTQALDDASFDHGLERTVADQQRMTQEILKQRHEAKNKLRERRNARIAHGSPPPSETSSKSQAQHCTGTAITPSWPTTTTPARGGSSAPSMTV